jgi:hypothetical protein
MSNQLAISSALSVLLMAGYVLLCPDASRVPLGEARPAVASAPLGLLPDASALVRAAR